MLLKMIIYFIKCYFMLDGRKMTLRVLSLSVPTGRHLILTLLTTATEVAGYCLQVPMGLIFANRDSFQENIACIW